MLVAPLSMQKAKPPYEAQLCPSCRAQWHRETQTLSDARRAELCGDLSSTQTSSSATNSRTPRCPPLTRLPKSQTLAGPLYLMSARVLRQKPFSPIHRNSRASIAQWTHGYSVIVMHVGADSSDLSIARVKLEPMRARYDRGQPLIREAVPRSDRGMVYDNSRLNEPPR